MPGLMLRNEGSKRPGCSILRFRPVYDTYLNHFFPWLSGRQFEHIFADPVRIAV